MRGTSAVRGLRHTAKANRATVTASITGKPVGTQITKQEWLELIFFGLRITSFSVAVLLFFYVLLPWLCP